MSAKARLRLDGADPINAGLLGFWPLAENGGNIAQDISPLRGSGLLTNAPSRVFGRLGRGVALNGSSQYVATTRAQALTTFSAVAWVNVTPATGNNQTIISSMRGVDNTILWQISNGQTMEFWANTMAPNASSGTFADVRGTWACVGVSWAIGRSTNFYVGGRLFGTSSTSGDIQTPITGWNLGRYGVPAARYFNGSLAMVRTWDRVLQPGEFLRLYRDPWAGTARRPLRGIAVPGTAYPLDAQPVGYKYTPGAVGLEYRRTLDARPVGYQYSPAPVDFIARRTLAAEGVVYHYAPANVALNYYPATDAGDTHDGFIRRTRRQRAMDAAERQRRSEAAQEAVSLRLSLEEAMGLAAEAVEDAPEPVANVVETATREAARFVPMLARGPAPDVLQAANEAIVALRSAIAAADRARMLAEDDEDVLMLLRAL